eukprot:m.138501 g.138501  ORF g.138501 m.138501 type:complete len:100 (+) comp38247_c0_seq7:135-434(+)
MTRSSNVSMAKIVNRFWSCSHLRIRARHDEDGFSLLQFIALNGSHNQELLDFDKSFTAPWAILPGNVIVATERAQSLQQSVYLRPMLHSPQTHLTSSSY